MTTQFDNTMSEWEEALDEEMTVKFDSIIRINGKSFRCLCGCNVFRKLVTDETKYKCNSCDEIYRTT